WCMGTPADYAETVTLTQVTSVRTCGDHGYIATAGQLWAWLCPTNALARALDLMPFKDVFRADPEVAGDNGEAEALLSGLSTPPVGPADRVARPAPVLARERVGRGARAARLAPWMALAPCRAVGLLIKPDVPIAAPGRSMLANT